MAPVEEVIKTRAEAKDLLMKYDTLVLSLSSYDRIISKTDIMTIVDNDYRICDLVETDTAFTMFQLECLKRMNILLENKIRNFRIQRRISHISPTSGSLHRASVLRKQKKRLSTFESPCFESKEASSIQRKSNAFVCRSSNDISSRSVNIDRTKRVTFCEGS
eukprot:CAMPEP_0185043104 /NCGR_PEP_ID=MMETSP1103-20130426/42721_1 /TAXON_ID=36769 /ORGANISM="Paraphysomonas bandaiensis, Strain Caron Lab Isolate" /LENGTH=161 /DNA_ID=CAMNT_0027583247 /DNA_START=1176 /DNA_END=1661 /DNA_ORIENTATION=+